MIRSNLHLTKEQKDFLHGLEKIDGLPVAEHVRRAIDDYIEKKKNNVSVSLSKFIGKKGGVFSGGVSTIIPSPAESQ